MANSAKPATERNGGRAGHGLIKVGRMHEKRGERRAKSRSIYVCFKSLIDNSSVYCCGVAGYCSKLGIYSDVPGY